MLGQIGHIRPSFQRYLVYHHLVVVVGNNKQETKSKEIKLKYTRKEMKLQHTVTHTLI